MRAREKPAVWQERVEAHRRSGMTIKAYAAKIGVNPNTLSGWRWKLRRRAEREQPVADDRTLSSGLLRTSSAGSHSESIRGRSSRESTGLPDAVYRTRTALCADALISIECS